LKFYNEHAHLFANNVEGVHVTIELSHPRVVSATLDRYNSTLSLQSEGSGECNVILSLSNNPAIFDVLKVKVATIVQPSSPVNLHIGSTVKFIIEGKSNENIPWSSSNSKVLSIEA
jgi:hypothetical protein